MIFNAWRKIFRKNPIERYLSVMLSFAINSKSTDLYFYVDNEDIKVFYNPCQKAEPELAGMLDFPQEDYKKLKRDIFGIRENLEPLVIPKEFKELTTTPRRYQEGLETILAKKFGFKDICNLGDSKKYCKLKINKQKIKASLTKIPSKEGLGYYLKFYYEKTI